MLRWTRAGSSAATSASAAPGAFRWHATADVLGGEGTTTGRIYGEVRRSVGKRQGLTVRVKGGVATAPTLRQTAFRLGGIGTVRGHDYGARRGQAFWAAQLDVTPLPGRLRPVLFVDAGQAGGAGSLFSGRVLAGAGVGLSVFGGLLRFDLSRAVSPDEARAQVRHRGAGSEVDCPGCLTPADPVVALERLVAGLVGAVACSSGEPADSRTGSLEVEWTGADTGKLSAPAVAEWCDSLELLELRAIHGDTGIALVLYPSGLASRPRDRHPGVPGAPAPRADSSRPSAAVALRWFAETSIRGFRGDSGTVVLEATGPGASAGRFSAYLRSATEGSRLTVTGSFKGLTVTPAPQGCVGRPPQEPDEPDELDEPDEADRPASPPTRVGPALD